MAKLHKRHVLDGFSGQVGRHLKLHDKVDGKQEVRHLECPPPSLQEAHWEYFKEAVAYARKVQKNPEYVEEAERRHTTPFKVATADFLHPPEIARIDLEGYHGNKGDIIQVIASDDVMVTQVGVIITDETNHLVEMGMAKKSKAEWSYEVTHQAPTHHVRVIVDVADLPGHLAEGRAEKDV